MSADVAASRWPRMAGVAGRPPIGPRFVAIAFWVLLPMLSVLTIVVGTSRVNQHINNMPAGILGTYVVTAHSCSGEICVTGGTFTSANGRLVESNLLGVYSWQDGQTHKAIYDSDSIDVIPLPAHWDPTAFIVGIAGAFGFLALWSFTLYGAIRRRVGS